MKKLTYIFFTLLTGLIISCAKDKNAQSITNADLQKIASIETNNASKQYITDNSYIDIDMKLVNAEINDKTKNKYQKPELAKAKAAIYRFYKNVSIKDGHYVHQLKSGKELNISDQVFSLLSDNLIAMNKQLDSLRAKNINVEMSAPDASYLNSLLK